MELSGSTCNTLEKQDDLSLWGDDIGEGELHAFVSITPNTVAPEKNGRSDITILLTLARLDAYIATCLLCLQDDDLDSVESHRQKLYLDMFTKFLPFAHIHLISVV